MKLMTKELEKKIPKLGSTENVENPKIVVHYFNPCGKGDWYVLEGREEENGDWLFFGWVDLFCKELGYFTLKELENVELPFGLGIERDLYWGEKSVNEVI